jgi:hypothetical protein
MKYADVVGLRQKAEAAQRWGNAVIKDIIVNLTVDASHDAAGDYAISVARAFEAHLAGISFAYEPVVPGSVFGSVAVELMATHRAECEKAARAAVSHFDEATRRVGLPLRSRLPACSAGLRAGSILQW